MASVFCFVASGEERPADLDHFCQVSGRRRDLSKGIYANEDAMSNHDLTTLSDDELIALAVPAREAGDHGRVREVLGVLIYRRLPNVKRRVAIRVPAADVEDVAMDAVLSALRAAFDGSSVGEFVNFLNTIVARRIADYHRRNEVKTTRLPEEAEGEDNAWADKLGAGDPDDWVADTIDSSVVIRKALDELSEVHHRVVELFAFNQLNANETAEGVNMEYESELEKPMSETNVHKIASRFRKRVRELLEEADNSA